MPVKHFLNPTPHPLMVWMLLYQLIPKLAQRTSLTTKPPDRVGTRLVAF